MEISAIYKIEMNSSAATREFVSFGTSANNDGLSIWVSQGRQHNMSLMRSKPKGIPKFNCHSVYLVLEQKHDLSILGDKPFTVFKAYFWIGSRSKNHRIKVEKAMQMLE